jgi:predicted transcriptional regulator
LDDRLGSVAATLARPREWVVEQATKEFVDLQAWHVAAIDEGIKEADAGKLIPHDRVIAWLDSWGTPDELPMPRTGCRDAASGVIRVHPRRCHPLD